MLKYVLKYLLEKYLGNVPVYIYYQVKVKQKLVAREIKYAVWIYYGTTNASLAFIFKISEILILCDVTGVKGSKMDQYTIYWQQKVKEK